MSRRVGVYRGPRELPQGGDLRARDRKRWQSSRSGNDAQEAERQAASTRQLLPQWCFSGMSGSTDRPNPPGLTGMILEQLTLRNFCLFRGEQVFDLTPAARNGTPSADRPVRRHQRRRQDDAARRDPACPLRRPRPVLEADQPRYDEFLRQSIHHGVNGSEGAGVSLSFRYAADGEEHLYEVCRSWNASEGRQVREELRVLAGRPARPLALGALDPARRGPLPARSLAALLLRRREDPLARRGRDQQPGAGHGRQVAPRPRYRRAAHRRRRGPGDAAAKKLGRRKHQAQVEALEQRAPRAPGAARRLSTERSGTRRTTACGRRRNSKEAEEAFAAGGGRHWEARRSAADGSSRSRARRCTPQASWSPSPPRLPLAWCPTCSHASSEQDDGSDRQPRRGVIQRLLVGAGRAASGRARRGEGERRLCCDECQELSGLGPARAGQPAT